MMEGDISSAEESSFEILPYPEEEGLSELQDEDGLQKYYSNIKILTPIKEMKSSSFSKNSVEEKLSALEISDLGTNSFGSDSFFLPSSYHTCFGNSRISADRNTEESDAVNLSNDEIMTFRDSKSMTSSSCNDSISVTSVIKNPKIRDSQETIMNQVILVDVGNQISCQTIMTKETLHTVKHSNYHNYSNNNNQEIPISQSITVHDSSENMNARQAEKFSGRTGCSKSICEAVKVSLNVCKWFRTNNFLKCLVERAKASVDILCSAIEMELYGIKESDGFTSLTIVSEESNFSSIRKGFMEVFHGKIVTSTIHAQLDFVPVLPIGYSTALKAVEKKIEYVREHALVQHNDLIVSTSSFLFQAVPHIWQLGTVLCLYDSTLQTSMHNFTVTTPVPNELVLAAERHTPPDYPHRKFGLAVSIEQVIDSSNGVRLRGIPEFFSGFHNYRALNSAALILAGMYKKYVDGLEYDLG